MIAVGTRLEGELLEIAQTNAVAAEMIQPGNVDDLALQNRATIVAILCASSALEAFINQEAFDRDPQWWSANERLAMDEKWEQLLERETGKRPDRGSGWFQALVRLYEDRNIVAHYKGLRHGRVMSFSGPPRRTKWGTISATRAYLDAARARSSVDAAAEAIRQFYAAVGSALPAFLPIWLRNP